MKFLSVCSGIEAVSCAWHSLGFEAFAFSEIDPFPCAVLAHHYPHVPNFGDMSKFQEWPDAADVDVLVGGTPCQSFSVAGLRKGLDDPRGNLMLTYGAIAGKYRPKWLVWENVPGVLSSNGGRDFGTFLGMLGQLGYGFAYRILDAQYFGVAQRRRRVFVVGCLGDWRSAAAVLFERHSLQGHPAPSREKRESTAISPALRARANCSHRADSQAYIPDLSPALKARDYKGPSSDGDFAWEKDISTTLDTTGGTLPNSQYGVRQGMQVRRLTPIECERLQGFPEIVKTCTITVFQHSNSDVCLSDQQSTNVPAALQSHKSPNNASPVEENVFPSNANAAELRLNAGQENSSAPVLVNVRIDLERQHLQLHSQGKLLLSASIADASEWCLLPIQVVDFVQLSVALLACLEKTAPTGRAALHLNMIGSFPLLIGNWFASQSGREIEEFASDAGKFISAVKSCMKSITSEAGRNSPNCDSILQTLLCCVTTAISSFIPEKTRAASLYALSVEVSHGYTLIPWRKKLASECPDGPRYKALGNSMAVPVMRWIGERILAVESVNEKQITRMA